jgi:hypothetical protein
MTRKCRNGDSVFDRAGEITNQVVRLPVGNHAVATLCQVVGASVSGGVEPRTDAGLGRIQGGVIARSAQNPMDLRNDTDPGSLLAIPVS